MKQSWFSIRHFAIALAAAGAMACGDDDSSSDDDGDDDGTGSQVDAGTLPDGGGVPDGGEGDPDAGPDDPDAGPTGPAFVWVHGDVVTDQRVQMAAYTVGGELPAVPTALLPLAETGQLATFQSVNSGAYDITPNGEVVALPADFEVPGRFDLYVARPEFTEMTQAVVMTELADVAKARLSPDGSRIAFLADLETDGVFGAYVVDSDAVNATPTLVSPAAATDDVDDLVWSRDSTSLLLTGDFTEASFFELMIVDVTKEDPTTLTLINRADIAATTTSAGAIQPIMARAGQVLFRGRLDVDNVMKLYVIDAAGGPPQVLPNSTIQRTDGMTIAAVGAVGLSPNQQRLAFAADETSGVFDLWVIPSLGEAAPTRVTSGLTLPPNGTINPIPSQPIKWRRDNLAVAFIADYVTVDKNEAFIAPVDGSGHVRLTNILPDDNTIDAEAVDWSPDGSQVFVVGDFVTSNEVELFALDPEVPDQTTPPLVLDVITGGDLRFDITVTN